MNEDGAQTDWHVECSFWRGTRVYGDSLVFPREAASTLPTAQLLFAPTAALTVTDARRQIRHEEGRD